MAAIFHPGYDNETTAPLPPSSAHPRSPHPHHPTIHTPATVHSRFSGDETEPGRNRLRVSPVTKQLRPATRLCVSPVTKRVGGHPGAQFVTGETPMFAPDQVSPWFTGSGGRSRSPAGTVSSGTAQGQGPQ